MQYERMPCMGERYLGCGMRDRTLELDGVPGNDLGAYLDGGEIIVHGNCQDATGDTMNDGKITVHGGSGDALGYAMRGGEIYIRDSVGYRAGIHMKAYGEHTPSIVIGGSAGCFLGEYQAGGTIVVLGLTSDPDRPIVGDFCGTGMHGGRIVLRTDRPPVGLPPQIICRAATDDIAEIEPLLRGYCERFGGSVDRLLGDRYYLLVPNSRSPYRQIYCAN